MIKCGWKKRLRRWQWRRDRKSVKACGFLLYLNEALNFGKVGQALSVDTIAHHKCEIR